MSSLSFIARRGMYLDTRDEPKGYAALGESESPLQHEEEAVANCPVDVPPMDGEIRIDSV